jgi:hypothetical protein
VSPASSFGNTAPAPDGSSFLQMRGNLWPFPLPAWYAHDLSVSCAEHRSSRMYAIDVHTPLA